METSWQRSSENELKSAITRTFGMYTYYVMGRKCQLASISERERVKAKGGHDGVDGMNTVTAVSALEPLLFNRQLRNMIKI